MTDLIPDAFSSLGLAGSYIATLLAVPSAKEAGLAFGEAVAMWKWQRTINHLNRAAEIRKSIPGAKRVPPPEFLLPLLEDAANACGEDLEKMFASLTATSFTVGELPHPSIRATLKQLSGRDARLLKECAVGLRLTKVSPVKGQPYLNDKESENLLARVGATESELRVSFEVLSELGLVKPCRHDGRSDNGAKSITMTARFTYRGVEFMRACIPESVDSLPADPPLKWVEGIETEIALNTANRNASYAADHVTKQRQNPPRVG